MKLKTGDIWLVDTEGFIPSKIDWFQGNDLNHAGFIVKIFKKTYIFEAIDSGMAFTDVEDYLKRQRNGEDINFSVLRPKTSSWANVDPSELMQFILPLTQKPYGFVNLLFYQMIKYSSAKLSRLLRKVGIKVKWNHLWIGKSREKSTDKFICGKLVAYIYNHFTGKFNDNWWFSAPVDLIIDDFEQFEYKA